MAAGMLGCAALVLSSIGQSRVWLHTSGRLHVWYHVVLFAVLGALAMAASESRSGRETGVVLAVGFGLAMEFSQALMHHASMEWQDVGSDACGVAVGVVAWWLLTRWDGSRGGGGE